MKNSKIKNFIERLQNLPDDRKKIVLWTIVAILAVILGLFWFRITMDRLSKLGNEIGKIQLPKVEILDTGTPATETTDWKTYTNDEYGFEIKYPKDWHQISQNPHDVMEFLVFCPITDNNCSLNAVYLVVYNSQIGKDKLDFYRQQGAIEENIVVNSYPAIKIKESYCNGVPLLTNGVFMDKNNYSYEIQGPVFECGTDKNIINKDYGDLEGIFNQMFSTFKFSE